MLPQGQEYMTVLTIFAGQLLFENVSEFFFYLFVFEFFVLFWFFLQKSFCVVFF